RCPGLRGGGAGTGRPRRHPARRPLARSGRSGLGRSRPGRAGPGRVAALHLGLLRRVRVAGGLPGQRPGGAGPRLPGHRLRRPVDRRGGPGAAGRGDARRVAGRGRGLTRLRCRAERDRRTGRVPTTGAERRTEAAGPAGGTVHSERPVEERRTVERTLVLIKPDGVRRNIVGDVISRIERKGLRIIALELRTLDEETAKSHYEEHTDKPFFSSLVEFITGGPLVAMVVEGNRAVEAFRSLA